MNNHTLAALLNPIVPHGARLLWLAEPQHQTECPTISAVNQLSGAGVVAAKKLERQGEADFIVYLDTSGAIRMRRMLSFLRDIERPAIIVTARSGFEAINCHAIHKDLMISATNMVGDYIAIRVERQRPVTSSRRRVVVLSSAGWPNFGDRLGYHMLHRILPPSAFVEHIFIPHLPVVGEGDLLILFLGTSIFDRIATRELVQTVYKAPVAIGIFGTQYRERLDGALIKDLISGLTLWCARYEEDAYLYGGSGNTVHLGDWLIDCFPLGEGMIDGELFVENAILSEEVSLDRLIQKIQSYKRVRSARLHPFLCALTSAEKVSYVEQRELNGAGVSGKFRSLLLDIFRRTYDENTWIPVDRNAVIRYKEVVNRGVEKLRDFLFQYLT